ncbi:hypothetical protein KR018_003511 [Drosophila ironensis]|nr:hypothetical protein KR018_003511 [Drosophila ironensis]
MEGSSSSSSIIDLEMPTDPGHPTQITSIDGFFNRKRGRPPKNRFVEVYKSAQHSPQAIFTSFKLERSDPGSSVSSPGMPLVDAAEDLDPDLMPSRNRKRGRMWEPSVSPQCSDLGARRNAAFQADHSAAKVGSSLPQSGRIDKESPSQILIKPDLSVVRAAGTFYPENVSSPPRLEFNGRQDSTPPDVEVDQPEDLSMRPSPPDLAESKAAAATDPTPALNMNLLQFKQLIDLYQRQVLLPSFLAAANQPMALPTSNAGPDMRLLLESAAHQKLMLLNAAVAATANVTATATAAAAVTASAVAAPSADSACQRTPARRIRDHDIPSGYLKFRFNEDCGFERCGYRNHQSHFHCNRRDCHYSFCDKTRFVQHTARHERMDTLMGDDFQQFRANMQCGVASCSYAAAAGRPPDAGLQNRPGSVAVAVTDALGSAATTSKKTSHFHCRKCDYVCTDSNKVVAHRRLHLRQDYVRSAGFRKMSGNEACNSSGCTYALRHTHYHCVTCDGGVLSRAQLSAHKHRTLLPKQEADATP